MGNRYLENVYGTHLLPVKSSAKIRKGFRAIRMLISYQHCGEFEFRCPSVEYSFDGNFGKLAFAYLSYCRNELGNAEKTLQNKRLYLHDFSNYMDDAGIMCADLSIEVIEDFFKYQGYSLASRHNCANMIRHFLQHIYDEGHSEKDCSLTEPYTMIIHGKGNKGRYVLLLKVAIPHIQKYLSVMKYDCDARYSEFLFKNHMGKQFTRQGLNYLLKKYGCKRTRRGSSLGS